MTDTQRRHAEDRPLQKLTDHELDVLDQLGRISHVFKSHIVRGLDDLADLAVHETAQRDYEKSRVRAVG